jgi:hypothetical protein
MDEVLFRGYFVKLYKSLVKMEEKFLELMSETESQAFIVFTKGLKDLAQYFNCAKEVLKPKKTKNLSKRKVTELTTKLIFGVG